MSELKAYRPRELVMQGRHNEPIYLKSEADKVIAKLQSKITLASLAEDCSNLRNKRCNYCSELQRQKYKRCLSMAELCDAEADVADADGDYEDMRWYQKWHERWLAIAEKFKETK